MKNFIPPILLSNIFLIQIFHRFFSNRFSQMLLEILIIDYSTHVRLFLIKASRLNAKSKIRVIFDVFWNHGLLTGHVLSLSCSLYEII